MVCTRCARSVTVDDGFDPSTAIVSELTCSPTGGVATILRGRSIVAIKAEMHGICAIPVFPMEQGPNRRLDWRDDRSRAAEDQAVEIVGEFGQIAEAWEIDFAGAPIFDQLPR